MDSALSEACLFSFCVTCVTFDPPQMVWSLERDAGPPPLSVILPRLYLGAERDVTQVRAARRVLQKQQQTGEVL